MGDENYSVVVYYTVVDDENWHRPDRDKRKVYAVDVKASQDANLEARKIRSEGLTAYVDEQLYFIPPHRILQIKVGKVPHA